MGRNPDKRRKPAETDVLRVPPYSIEAEAAVLGGLMLSEQAWDTISDLVREEDFYRHDHRLIYRAMGELASKNIPRDAVTLGEWLERQGLAEDVGGSGYVIELAATTPGAANIRAYADIVREKSVLRQLLDASTDIAADCFNSEGRTSKDVLDDAERRIFTIAEHGSRGKQGLEPIKTSMKEAFVLLQERFENKGKYTGLTTGYPDLDKMTTGLQPSDLILIAGRPSMGKTSLAICIAEHVALVENRGVAVFSMEMSPQQLALRMLSSVGRINQQRLRIGDLDDDDWGRVSTAISRLLPSKLFIDGTPALTPGELRSRVRRHAREHDLGLVVIDYLQLMTTGTSSRPENRANEIAEISRQMKALAKELNVPVIALSQLNRSLEQRADKRPVMSDLRESGGLEQDADVIAFVYRDEYYFADSPDKGLAEVIISKQRNGPVGTVKLAFRGELVRFDTLSQDSYAGHFE